jgi:perosamine synthetase
MPSGRIPDSVSSGMNEFPLMAKGEGIPLFYPHVPPGAAELVANVLSGRWIGQGPLVDLFESQFSKQLTPGIDCVAVNSCTSALHLAYILSDIQKDDHVISPVFTCTATNIPLLYLGANIDFVDVDVNTLNPSIADIESRITLDTKAVVVVDYGGIPNDYIKLKKLCDKYSAKLIVDAAHSLGSTYSGLPVAAYADFTAFSFQAIKTLTTGDGGMLAIHDSSMIAKAKRLRWFGIDRSAKQNGIWENDIIDIGYKYQMNDIAAAIGLHSLETIDDIFSLRKAIYATYLNNINNPYLRLLSPDSPLFDQTVPWLATVLVKSHRLEFMAHLRQCGVESGQVHYRNDRYSIFSSSVKRSLPGMDSVNDDYICIPLHTKLDESDVNHIVASVNSFSPNDA